MEDLEDTHDFDQDTLPDVVPLDAVENYSNYEVNGYVAYGGGKENNNSSPTLHADIPEY